MPRTINDKRQQILLVFVLLFHMGTQYSFQVRTIALDKFSQCPQDENNAIRFNGTIVKIAQNKYAVNGEISIKHNISSPIEVSCIIIL